MGFAVIIKLNSNKEGKKVTCRTYRYGDAFWDTL